MTSILTSQSSALTPLSAVSTAIKQSPKVTLLTAASDDAVVPMLMDTGVEMAALVSEASKNTDVNEDDEIEYIEKSLPKKQPNVNQFDENTDSFSGEQQTKAYKATNGAVPVGGVSPSPSTGSGSSSSSSTKAVSNKQLNSSKDNSAKKGKNYWKEQLPASANFTNNKDEHISR